MAKSQKLLIELREILGPEATLQMQRCLGGQRIYVPCQLSFFHPLVLALGMDLAGELAYRYGGCQIEVPFSPEIDREERNRRIAEDRAQGVRLNELVTKYRIGFRQVQAILRQARVESPTPQSRNRD